MSGTGAKNDGGRWNEKGLAVVYMSETRSLACLETIVHLNAGGLPLNRILVDVQIPDDVWKARETVDLSQLVGWDVSPASVTSIAYGNDWLRSRRSALLVVPSVIVPEEMNVLVNPTHSDSAALVAVKRRRWTYDPRITKHSISARALRSRSGVSRK